MNKDIYAAPESALENGSIGESVLASRWARLGASLIDSIIVGLIMLPVMYYMGLFQLLAEGLEPSIGYTLLLGLVGAVAFFIINGKFLIDNGQTVGKKVLGIKVVDLDGNKATLKKHLITRYAFYAVPGQIPIIGPLISMVNIVFIFGKQKRCLHDYIARTKVIVA